MTKNRNHRGGAVLYPAEYFSETPSGRYFEAGAVELKLPDGVNAVSQGSQHGSAMGPDLPVYLGSQTGGGDGPYKEGNNPDKNKQQQPPNVERTSLLPAPIRNMENKYYNPDPNPHRPASPINYDPELFKGGKRTKPSKPTKKAPRKSKSRSKSRSKSKSRTKSR